MKKIRLIDLLVLVANKELEDGTMVLIDNDSYKFSKKDEKFYVPPYKNSYRNIFTDKLNLTCYILEDYQED